MPIIDGNYAAPVWEEQSAPAINGTELNAISQTIAASQAQTGDIRFSYRQSIGDDYLPCDGREIDDSLYPELSAIMATDAPSVSVGSLPSSTSGTISYCGIATNGAGVCVAAGTITVTATRKVYPYIAYSSDGGATWAGKQYVVSFGALSDVQASAARIKYLNGNFVILASWVSSDNSYNDRPILIYSTDGIVWNSNNISSNVGVAKDLIYDGSAYLVLLRNAGSVILSSTQLTRNSWYKYAIGGIEYPETIAFYNSFYYIAGGLTAGSTQTQVLKSANFSSWSTETVDSVNSIILTNSSAQGDRVIFTGYSGSNDYGYIVTYDGSAWTTAQIDSVTKIVPSGLHYFNGTWAISARGFSDKLPYTYRSSDLSSWTQRQLSTTALAVGEEMLDLTSNGTDWLTISSGGTIFSIHSILNASLTPDISVPYGNAFIRAVPPDYIPPLWINNSEPFINADNFSLISNGVAEGQYAVGDVVISTQNAPDGFLELKGQTISASDYPTLTALVNAFNGVSGNNATLPDVSVGDLNFFVKAG